MLQSHLGIDYSKGAGEEKSYGILKGKNTEYTQSGNGNFLAYIPSLWKNHPSLVRVGGARPKPLSLYLPSRTKLWCTLQLRKQIQIQYTPQFLLCKLYVLCGEKYQAVLLTYDLVPHPPCPLSACD
jgi:hypothetical protein